MEGSTATLHVSTTPSTSVQARLKNGIRFAALMLSSLYAVVVAMIERIVLRTSVWVVAAVAVVVVTAAAVVVGEVVGVMMAKLHHSALFL